MQIKFILRCHNTPCPSSRKDQQQILIRMLSKETHILFQGMQIGPVTGENNMEHPHKNKNRIII